MARIEYKYIPVLADQICIREKGINAISIYRDRLWKIAHKAIDKHPTFANLCFDLGLELQDRIINQIYK